MFGWKFKNTLNNFFKGIKNRWRLLVGGGIATPIIFWLWSLIRDTILGEFIVFVTNRIFPQIGSFFLETYKNNPIAAAIGIFLLYITIIFFKIYLDTKPPTGITVEIDPAPLFDDIEDILIGNYTNEDINECVVTIEEFVKSPLSENISYKYRLPDEFMWVTRNGVKEKKPDIKAKRDPVRLAIAFSKLNNQVRGALATSTGIELLQGVSIIRLYLSGYTLQGKNINKEFQLKIICDRNGVKVLRIIN
ncbi:MAG: hypothetical protein JXB38_13290 [Anaerolineales bacterium]|nr:hypothetical protein [Anaerolineales bacterium]